MSVADLCIYLLIAMLSVAYPILLQVISRLDEKYSSVVIVDLFEKEKEYARFRELLVSTLVFIACYAVINLFITLNAIPCINQIVVYLLVASTSLLIIYFLLFISKILTYYTPSKIVAYFITKKDNQEYEYFKALGDVLYFSIEQQKEVFAKMIIDYYTKAFIQQRGTDNSTPVVYPQPYYELISNIVSRLAPLKNRRFGFLEHRTVGGIWLIGNLENKEISENTYSSLWNSLTIAINHERDDMVMQYWATAYDHLERQLPEIDRQFQEGSTVVINQAAIDKRHKDRQRFIEFNQALLGLLLYKNRLNCIKRIFGYTTSTHQSSNLLPLYMSEVFDTFFRFWDVYDHNFPFISFTYWYPETEGINSDGLVKLWTSSYAALLFLKQYSIVPRYIYVKPLDYPAIPAKKSDRTIWIENLDHFKRLVSQLYENRELMTSVGLGFLTDEWCVKNGKIKPLDFIDNVKAMVQDAYAKAQYEQEIAAEEREKFKASTKLILETTLQPYLDIFSNPIDEDYKSYYLNGVRGIMPKDDFAADKDVDSFNHFSIHASTLSTELKEGICNIFYFAQSVHYRLNEADFFPGIDRLELNKDSYIILNLGIDFSFFNRGEKIEGLSDSDYKGIPIVNVPFYGRGTDRKIVIIKRSELPQVITLDIPQNQINKYLLEKLSDLNIYGSLTDLYRNNALREELVADEHVDPELKVDIEKKILIYIGLQVQIKWKNEASLITFSVDYSYMDEAHPVNALADVKTISVVKPDDGDKDKDNQKAQ
jgi:hypothetical protein